MKPPRQMLKVVISSRCSQHQVGLAGPVEFMGFEAVITIPELARLAVFGAVLHHAITSRRRCTLSTRSKRSVNQAGLPFRDKISAWKLDAGSAEPREPAGAWRALISCSLRGGCSSVRASLPLPRTA